MKKIFALVCMTALLFAVAAFAATIQAKRGHFVTSDTRVEFRNGTVEIPKTWGFEEKRDSKISKSAPFQGDGNLLIFTADYARGLVIATDFNKEGHKTSEAAARAFSAKYSDSTAPRSSFNGTYHFNHKSQYPDTYVNTYIRVSGDGNLVTEMTYFYDPKRGNEDPEITRIINSIQWLR